MLLWLRRHLGRVHGALAAFATLGTLAAVFAYLVFAAFAAAVRRGMTQPLDESVLHALAARRSPLLDFVMGEATTLGNVAVLGIVVTVAALFLWLTRHRWSALLLLLGAAGGVIVNTALKTFIDRARPEVVDALAHVSSPSFPSGHAMNSLIVYGSVAYIVGRLEPTAVQRRVTWLVATLLITVIGVSRVYLGVHYPSDILAGFLAGVGWLFFLVAGVAALRWFDPEHRR
jgi:undecaprenyl-diphosphatase